MLLTLLATVLIAFAVQAHHPPGMANPNIRAKTLKLIEQLNRKQKKAAIESFDSRKKSDWHYVPKSRNGLPLKKMTQEQRTYVLNVLKELLSQQGFFAATTIMDLEDILKKEGSFFVSRDPLGYYLEVFGTPSKDSAWGLSFEGHHLSLNYIIKNDKVIGFSPLFLGANPAEVKKDYGVGPKKGTRPLAAIEDRAFELVNSLSQKQRKEAVLSKEPIDDVVGGGMETAAPYQKKGIPFGKLTKAQQIQILGLVKSYLSFLPDSMKGPLEKQWEKELLSGTYFSWYGSLKPGVGHYYRIDNPQFIVELANTQSDASGNPANHVHALWMSR